MLSSLLKEINEQPDVLIRVAENFMSYSVSLDELAIKIKSGYIQHIILTGMGASYYSCYPLWLKLSNHGLPVSLWETSELVNFSPNGFRSSTLVIAVSQSGESAEINRLINLEKQPGFKVGITNASKNGLFQWSDLVLELSAGDETSVSTKTYLASLAALDLLGCKITGENLERGIKKLHVIAGRLRSFLQNNHDTIEELYQFLISVENLAILGRGYSLASANCGALFLKEAARIATMGLSSAQFRHGPMEIVGPGFGAIVFSGCENVEAMNNRLASDIAGLGGKVILVTSKPEGFRSDLIIECVIPAVDCELLPMIEIIPIQQLAIPLASSQGFEAGVFKNSGKVTLTE
jgi:glucosamine--fructose-6-phosphate aminotransferase (isomerizing)